MSQMGKKIPSRQSSTKKKKKGEETNEMQFTKKKKRRGGRLKIQAESGKKRGGKKHETGF